MGDAAGPVHPVGEGVRIDLKVVPGASRGAIAGPYGNRLRVRVAAAPEGGKANRAVIALVARTLGVPERAVSIVKGRTSPAKSVAVEGVDVAGVRAALGLSP